MRLSGWDRRRKVGSAVPGWGHLQVGDDAVLYVLLLLAQEVEAYGVERVGAELVFPQQHLGWGGRVGPRPGPRPHKARAPLPTGTSRTCSMSICTRPTMLTTLLSRRPVCFDWKDESRMVERRLITRPRKGNLCTWGRARGQLQRGPWPGSPRPVPKERRPGHALQCSPLPAGGSSGAKTLRGWAGMDWTGQTGDRDRKSGV